MMVVAISALPQMISWAPSTQGRVSIMSHKERPMGRCNLHVKSPFASVGKARHFKIAVIPAKTPKLIATATPNFSFLLICKAQSRGHGRSARRKSIAAEYDPEKIEKAM